MIDSFLQGYEVPEGITINLHATVSPLARITILRRHADWMFKGHSLGGAYATLCYAELMRLYNNMPTDPGVASEDPHASLAKFFSQLKERQFVLRDLYTFGCPRVGGVMSNVDWAKSYKSALDNHNGKSWRVKNNYDPVTAVPPVVPLISTWNHVDNGYQVNDSSSPEALPTEIGTQPGISLKPWNFPYHCELVFAIRGRFLLYADLIATATTAYFQNIYNASTTGPKIKIDLIQQLLDEAGPAPEES